MFENQERTDRSAANFIMSGFVRKLLLDVLMAVRFLIAAVLFFLEPIIGFILCLLAIILVIVSIVLKISGDAPKFPFWGAIGMSVGLYLLSMVYALVVRLIAPKPHE
ncbi:MAG: hypothetical protein M3O41_03535 [Pseudomonadota bacterium]|nr:hypothetical protein [Pseudomonadota bacterium]